MTVKFSVLVLFALFGFALSAPATKDDVEVIPPNTNQYGGEPIVDTDAGYGNPFFNPFGGLVQGLEAMMTRMRHQLDQVLNRLPARNGSAGFNPIVPFEGIDLSKGNTTSVTKVIDGHKVTINETEYKNEGEDGAAFFKVRIINVEPDSSETTANSAEVVPTNGSGIESMDDESRDNEVISKDRENEVNNPETLETFDEVVSSNLPPQIANTYYQTQETLPETFERVETLDEIGSLYEKEPSTTIDEFERTNLPPKFDHLETFDEVDASVSPLVIPDIKNAYQTQKNSAELLDNVENDLTGDVYVNQLMADAGVSPDPDAEVFDPIEAQVPVKYAKFEKVDPR